MTPTRDDQQTSRPESLPWVERLVEIDTTSRGSNLELIDVVTAELRARGLQPEIFPDDTGTKANLVVTVPAADGTRTGGVVLSAHTDVVPVDGQAWSSEPFTAEVRDGRLYGRGTADMKGFLGVALHLLPRMLEASLSEPIHLALSYDEEVGCVGGAELVKQLASLGLAPRACLVGEPTSLRVIRAHKSVNLVRVTFSGVAAHSSLTSSGVNAIEYGARFITAVRGLADGWRADGPFDEGFEVPHTTIGVNVVEGGIAANTVPDRCVLTLDFRSIAADDPGDIVERLRGFAAEVERDMKAEHEDAAAEVEVLAMVPGLDAAPDDPAALLAVELGATRSDEKVTYGTEAGQFAGTGIPTVVCGPGDIAQAHKADEFVDLDQLVACEQLIGRLIDSLSG